ncbi:MAG: YncE family protein [Thermoplasmata archaeon]
MRLSFRQAAIISSVSLLLLGSAFAVGVLPAGGSTPGVASGASAPELTVPPNPPSTTPVVGVIATTPVGDLPTFLVQDTASGLIYVTDQGADNVTVLRGTSPIATVPVGTGDEGIAFSSSNGTIYVANYGSESVTIINGTTVERTLPVGSDPISPVYDPTDGLVYVPDFGSSSVDILNGTAVLANVTIGEGPVNAIYDPALGDVVITSEYSESESVLSGTTVVESIDTGLVLPDQAVYDATNGLLYVMNQTIQPSHGFCPPNCGIHYGSGIAVVIRNSSVVTTVGVGGGPGYATVDTENGWLYVPDGQTDSVTVLNGTTLVGTVGVGGLPEASQYDPADGLVYVVDQLTGAVSVINGTTLIAQPSIGIYPEVTIYDPSNRQVYVADQGSSQVSVLGTVTGYSVQFEETGLPAGTDWSVTYQGVTRGAATPSILFYEPNGTFSYFVNPPTGYVPLTNATGETEISASAQVVHIVFGVASGSGGPAALPWLTLEVGAAVGAGIAAVLAWAFLTRRTRKRERIGRV